MTQERRRVLDMLAEGKITAEEAERLLEALRVNPGGETAESFDAPEEDPKRAMRDDSFAVGTSPRLVVRGFNGRVRVHAGSPGSIRVRAKLKSPHRISYSAVQEGDLVEVKAKSDRRAEGALPGFSRQSAGANIEVTVPAETSVDLATSNGSVELQGTVQTKNGRIRVEQFKGDLNATTKNAPISVKTFQGSATLSNVNSRVSVEDARGRFEVQTINGPIKFQGRIAPKSHNRLSTLNSNIKVALDAEPSLKLAAETLNGRVRCEVPGFVAAVNKHHKLEGTMGDGEAELIAKTVNGSITVQ